jgi:hypothetical protein
VNESVTLVLSIVDVWRSVTVLGLGTGAVTVIAEAPLTPSLVAVIVADPATNAETSPVELTDAMVVLPDQVTTRPVSTLLLASRVTAESCCVAPTCRLAVAGDTETEATGTGAGAFTVIAAEAVCPSLAAVMDTLPAATAVTSPELETLAMELLAEFQPMTRPVSTLPLASRVVADSCTVPPICRVELAGATDTDATGIGAGALTLKGEELVFPSLVAVIIVLPAPTAAIAPVGCTVATLTFELCQATARPESRFPLESCSVAVACAVCPTSIAGGLTATDTVATGVGGGGVTDILA